MEQFYILVFVFLAAACVFVVYISVRHLKDLCKEAELDNVEVGCPCNYPCNEHCYNLMEDNKRLPSGTVYKSKSI